MVGSFYRNNDDISMRNLRIADKHEKSAYIFIYRIKT